MRLVTNFLFATFLFISLAQIGLSQISVSPRVQTGLATLYALDPLTQSLCLRDGGPGLVFEAGQKRNRCSDLNFGSYSPNAFAVGIEGGRRGVILDLGTPQEMKSKYGFEETVGWGQGFASIAVRQGKALILKDYRSGRLQELAESARLFNEPSQASSSAPVKVGHIYLLRITDSHQKDYEMIAKLLVVANVPGESVTVRWQLLENKEAAKL